MNSVLVGAYYPSNLEKGYHSNVKLIILCFKEEITGDKEMGGY